MKKFWPLVALLICSCVTTYPDSARLESPTEKLSLKVKTSSIKDYTYGNYGVVFKLDKPGYRFLTITLDFVNLTGKKFGYDFAKAVLLATDGKLYKPALAKVTGADPMPSKYEDAYAFYNFIDSDAIEWPIELPINLSAWTINYVIPENVKGMSVTFFEGKTIDLLPQ